MTRMNQFFRRAIRDNAPNAIIFGSVCIVIVTIAACAYGQRKLPSNKDTTPLIEVLTDEPVVPHEMHGSLSVQEFVYDGNEYLLIEKNGALAVTKK